MRNKEPDRNVYVGHRYVPKLMGEWDKKIDYEGLSIVTYQGASYTSKKRVPVGIDILNEEFWVLTGNYNAQIEYYRKDVKDMEERVNENILLLKEDVDGTIESFKKDVNGNITSFKSEINKDIVDFKEDINGDITLFKETVNGELETVKGRITKNENDIKDINVNLKWFGAKGDGVTDDTNAFKNALQYALENNKNLYIPNPDVFYRVRDTISYGLQSVTPTSERLVIYGEHMKRTKIHFDPVTPGKPLFKMGGHSGYALFKNLELTDKSTRKNTAFELQDDLSATGSQNWKNHFEFIHITNFDKNFVLNGSSEAHSKDAHLDGMTLYKIAMWNYNIGIEINNTQSVQMNGYDVDFITTHSGDENSIGILNHVGAGWSFKGGSWISRGSFVKFNASSSYNSSNYVIDGARFEFRPPYNKPMIDFSEAKDGLVKWYTSVLLNLTVQNSSGNGFNNNVKLAKTPVIGKLLFDNCDFTNGPYHIDAYRTVETMIDNSEMKGGKGSVNINRCSDIKVNLLIDNDKYLSSEKIPTIRKTNSIHGTSTTGTMVDDNGFYYSRESDFETSGHHGLVYTQKKVTGIRRERFNRIPSEIKLMLPDYSIPLNIIISKAGFSHQMEVEYYAVKDKKDWVSDTFNRESDSYLLGTSDMVEDFGYGQGNISIPIDVDSTLTDVVGGGRTFSTDKSRSKWSEGRFMVRFVNKTSKELLTTPPIEFLLIEYI